MPAVMCIFMSAVCTFPPNPPRALLSLPHRFKRGYKNVISKGVELNQEVRVDGGQFEL